jgi:hypothetical protein
MSRMNKKVATANLSLVDLLRIGSQGQHNRTAAVILHDIRELPRVMSLMRTWMCTTIWFPI